MNKLIIYTMAFIFVTSGNLLADACSKCVDDALTREVDCNNNCPGLPLCDVNKTTDCCAAEDPVTCLENSQTTYNQCLIDNKCGIKKPNVFQVKPKPNLQHHIPLKK